MKNRHVLSLVLVLLCLALLGSVSSQNFDRYDRRGGRAWQATRKEKVETPTITETNFHKRLYHEILTTSPEKNIIFSPFSIQMCLALSHMGAGGVTADEIAQVIGYSSNFTVNDIATALSKANKNSDLNVANKAYVSSRYELNPEYERAVIKTLKSEVESIDFSQATSAVQTINDWVETQTDQKIKNVLKKGDVDQDTVIALVNAVYFKAAWARQFKAFENGTFTNLDATTKDLEFMKHEDDFKHVHDEALKANIVKLYYHRTRIAMFFVIPDETQGLSEIEQKMDQLNFKEVDARMDDTYMQFYVPRFEFEYDIPLNEPLKKLGMTTAFEDRADFSKTFKSGEHSKISNVIHKAFIKVDEKGTIAGAATVITRSSKIAKALNMTLKVDRPFLFAIVSDDYGTPLFMGAVKHL